MAMLPPKNSRKHAKGQVDHVDAWLISYADLITLLFMLFVIMVSVMVTKREQAGVLSKGEPEYSFVKERSGSIAMGTPYDDAYSDLVGIVTSRHADQNIALEKTRHGVWIDIASTQFFESGSADIPRDQLPLLKAIARVLKNGAVGNYVIEVQGHTDDVPLQNSPYKDSWDLAAVRATHVLNVLIDEGIDARHLRATSYAGVRPIVPNIDIAGNPIAQNRIRNQRIVIRMFEERT